MTPEGKVKAALNKALKEAFGDDLYRFMPVQMGYGASTVDYLLCLRGRFVAIEAKAPGKKPTDAQKVALAKIHRAGGICFVVDSVDLVGPVIALLNSAGFLGRTFEPALAWKPSD